MQQYHDLLRKIKEKGTHKAPARENMPSTLSLFGYQNRYDLQEGFPILTTKKVNFKHIVTELLWFLRGDTNVKYLIDNGCNIWNEDAYNYYSKIIKNTPHEKSKVNFEEFINLVKTKNLDELKWNDSYTLGDCGKQYGWLWRKWGSLGMSPTEVDLLWGTSMNGVDQIKELINGLKNNPTGRRHIITAWNPATLDDMALNACHAFVQFNCRPLALKERCNIHSKLYNVYFSEDEQSEEEILLIVNHSNIPKYTLDCQFFQRSCDVFLGCPYNIASYALLTHILAKICNMEVGDLIISYGDVHIYDNHIEAVDEILTRTPTELPTLKIKPCPITGFDLEYLSIGQFELENYNPQSSIKAKLSTGLK